MLINPSHPADRRAFGRRPTNQLAFAHVAGRPPLRCTVRDISEGGALLDFGGTVVLRNRLRLVWEGSGEQAECEVRHSQGGKAGVQFICSNGPRIARQTIGLGQTVDWDKLPPAAPPLVRERLAGAAGKLVAKFRQARLALAPPSGTHGPLPSDGKTVPLPLPARAYH